MIVFYLLVTVMPMIRHPLWSDLIGDLTIMKYLGIAALVYAVAYLPQRATPAQFLGTWQARYFVAFSVLVIALYIAFGNQELPIEISPLASFTSFLGLFFMTMTVIDSLDRLRWVLFMAVGSVTYASLHTVREWQKYGGMAAGYRPGWVTGDPNYFSISALLCLPIALYLLRTQQRQWERYFCFFSIGITLLGLTLAASRGGFVGLAAAAVVMALHSKRRLRTLVIIMAVTLPLMMIAPSSPLTRILSPDQHDNFSADHRLDLAAAGLAMFRANVLTGVGPGNFKSVLDRYADLDELHIAHNTYVEVMAETGVFGIILFLATASATLFSLERIRRHASEDLLRHTAGGLQVGLAGFLAGAFFVSAEAHRFFWLIVFLTMVLATLASQTQERTVPTTGRSRARARETVRQVP